MNVTEKLIPFKTKSLTSFSGLKPALAVATDPIKGETNLSFYGVKTAEVDKALSALQTNISFTGKLIDGVMYSNNALKLGEARITPEKAKSMYEACTQKKEDINAKKAADKSYTNARAGVVESATALGRNGKMYTSVDVDFFSSRWGAPAGLLASCMAINDFNDSVKAIAITNENHDRRGLNWLANTSSSLNKTRGGKDMQVVTARKLPSGKIQLQVKTLSDLPGFIPASLPKIQQNAKAPESGIKEYKPESVQINEILYSDKAKAAAGKLAAEKGINIDEMVKTLVLKSQDDANALDKKIVETKGGYDNAPVSHYRYISAVMADNGKTYGAYNTEFYDNGFMAEVLCSERTAIAKAVNDGANKIYAIAINNNQNHGDIPCAECLGWMSTSRAGNDVLIATIVRDADKNKTDKVQVQTLSDFMPTVYQNSPAKK